MSSIDPTVQLAHTRSLIDSVQQEISQLEGLMADFLALEGAQAVQRVQDGSLDTNAQATRDNSTQSMNAIREDFQEYLKSKKDLSPADNLQVLKTVAFDAGVIKETQAAWTDFAEESQSSATTRQALTVLKASLGALRVQESYWNKEQEEQKKMQVETNKMATI